MWSFLQKDRSCSGGGGDDSVIPSTAATLAEKQRETASTLREAQHALHGGAYEEPSRATFKALAAKANAASKSALSARRKPTPEETAAIKAYADIYEARRQHTNAGQAENVTRGKKLADDAQAYMKAHPEEQQLWSRNYVTGERMQYAAKDATAHHADQLQKFHQNFYDWEAKEKPDRAWFRDLNNRLIDTARKHVIPGGLLDRVLPQHDPGYVGRQGDPILDAVSSVGTAANSAVASTGVGAASTGLAGLAHRAGFAASAEQTPSATEQVSAPPTAKEPNDLVVDDGGKGNQGGGTAEIERLRLQRAQAKVRKWALKASVKKGGAVPVEDAADDDDDEDDDDIVGGGAGLDGGSRSSGYMQLAAATARAKDRLPKGFNPRRMHRTSDNLEALREEWMTWPRKRGQFRKPTG